MLQMVERELSAFTRLACRRAPRVGRGAERVLAWRLAEVTVRRMAPRASRWHHPPASFGRAARAVLERQTRVVSTLSQEFVSFHNTCEPTICENL